MRFFNFKIIALYVAAEFQTYHVCIELLFHFKPSALFLYFNLRLFKYKI